MKTKFWREYLDGGGMKKQEAGEDYITLNALLTHSLP